jgi:hypothetical protein
VLTSEDGTTVVTASYDQVKPLPHARTSTSLDRARRLTSLVCARPFAHGTWRRASARACTGATTMSSSPSRSRQPPLPLSPRTAKPYALPPLTHPAARAFVRVPRGACVSGRHESHTHARDCIFEIQDSNGNHRTRNARTRTKAGNKGGAGAYIASGSRDKTIRIWDTQTQQEVMTLVRRLRSFFIFRFRFRSSLALASGAAALDENTDLTRSARVGDCNRGRWGTTTGCAPCCSTPTGSS